MDVVPGAAVPAAPREVGADPALDQLILPVPGDTFDVRNYLTARHSGLATYRPEPSRDLCDRVGQPYAVDGKTLEYDAATWLHRCAIVAGINPRFLLWKLDVEEGGLLSPDQPGPYTVEVLPLPTAQAPMPQAGTPDPADHYYRAAEGLIHVRGDRRNFAAVGFGIPDPGQRAPWHLLPLLGWAAQVCHAALRVRGYLAEWACGARTVALYGDARHPAEVVRCGAAGAYALLSYTPAGRFADGFAQVPFGDMLTEAPQGYRRLGLMA